MRGRAGLVAAAVGVPVFVVLALWIGSLLLESCSLGPLTRWLGACPSAAVGVSGDLAAEMEETGRLEDRVRQLERQLALLRDCPLAPPQPPAEEEPLPEPPPPSGEPLSEDAPVPPEEPLPEDEPDPTDDEPPPPPEEDLPEDPLPEEEDESSEFDERVEDQEGEVSEELTVTLIWNDRSDLDLQVHCPGGGAVGANVGGCAGGVLDIDANGSSGGILRMMDQPVENIRFPTPAPTGDYRIRVSISDSYQDNIGEDRWRNTGAHPFRVRVISRGTEQVFEGVHPGLGQGDIWFSFVH